ncbi:MAG: transpeptidase family protein [Bacteroidales bacterium]|jgi:cell division protein FtsI (penicillin-binding protein 3)|nr:transpeptidase family protein [Bacteroidales bacterium]
METTEKNNRSKKFLVLRTIIVYVAFVLIAIAAIGKIIYVQIADKKELEQLSDKSSYVFYEKEAHRGAILATDGEVLLKRRMLFDIYMDTYPKDSKKPEKETILDSLEFFSNVQALADSLHALFPEKSTSYYLNLLKTNRTKKKRYVAIQKNINIQDYERMKNFPIFSNRKSNNCFISISKESYEKYDLAPRTLGYVRYVEKKDQTGETKIDTLKVGIEGAYDSILAGKKGNILHQRIGKYTWAEIESPENIYPENGKDIVTTLDVAIQDVAQKSLLENLKLQKAKSGCAIVMEVKTGEILAISSLNKEGEGKYAEIYNNAIGVRADPGSLFKTAALAVALKDGKIKLTDKYKVASSSEMFPGRKKPIKDSAPFGHNDPTVLEIFEKSSNVGTVKIIYENYKNNQQQFIDGLYSLGLNQPLGIELAGESAPYIKNTNDKTWSKSTITSMPMGYEVEMTPLQILAFYNAIANDGIFIRPKFVKEIRKNGEIIKTIESDTLIAKIAPEEVIKDLQTMLRGVVVNGTGREGFKGVSYAVAGKTGTAQVTTPGEKGYSDKRHNASFCGYFPADNPKYACIVMINEPSNGEYLAAKVALPVFRDIANKLYAVDVSLMPVANGYIPPDSVGSIPMNINSTKENIQTISKHIDLDLNLNDVDSDWVSVKTAKNEIHITPNNIESNTIPNVTGMSLSDAIYVLEEKGLTVETKGFGKVEKQFPSAGTVIGKTEKIILSLKI